VQFCAIPEGLALGPQVGEAKLCQNLEGPQKHAKACTKDENQANIICTTTSKEDVHAWLTEAARAIAQTSGSMLTQPSKFQGYKMSKK